MIRVLLYLNVPEVNVSQRQTTQTHNMLLQLLLSHIHTTNHDDDCPLPHMTCIYVVVCVFEEQVKVKEVDLMREQDDF